MRLTSLGVIFLMVALLCPKSNATSRGFSFKLLPADIKPDKYHLNIILNYVIKLGYFYKGHVNIKFHCEQPTKKIVLNEYELTIGAKDVHVFALENGETREIKIVDHGERDSGEQEYEILLEEDLLEGSYYSLQICFYKMSSTFGVDNTSFNNWFRNKKLIIVKNWDGVRARDLFPCFDQLDMKAQFEIWITHDYTVQGLSNSELASTKNFPDSARNMFQDTDRIATSSVAIALLDIPYKHTESFVSLAEFKISCKMFYISSDLFHLPNDVYSIICNILQYFLNFFAVPLKKFDTVISPQNKSTVYYGLFFLNEIDAITLISENNGSAKYYAYSKVCRATSKQWISHMTTMSHWYESWLHTGLNHFLGVSCVHKFLPNSENGFSQHEIVNTFLEVLQLESEGMYNPILQLNKAEFEFVLFDEKTKNKVYHLIRMMNFFLGSDIFQQGIEAYVKKYKFEVSTVINVWNSFTTAATSNEGKIGKTKILPSKFAVDEIMETWTNQNGLPIITVTRNDDSSVTVHQKPFPSLYETKPDEPKSKCWIVPLSFTTKTEHEFENVVVRRWLTCGTSLSVPIPNLRKDEWVLFNLNMNVLGRFNYDHNNWRQIEESLRHGDNYSGINTLTRAHLISDLFALTEVEEVPYNIAFDIMKYLSREENYAIWTVAANAFRKIWFLLQGTKMLKPLENYVESILKPIFKKKEYEFNSMDDLTSNNEEMKGPLKHLLFELSCNFNTNICHKISDAFIERWKTNPEEEWSEVIPSNINKAIHCQGVKDRNSKYRKKLRSIQMLKHIDYNVIAEALACAQNTRSLEKLLANYLIAYQEELNQKVLKSMILNKNGYQVMKNNFKRLLKSASKEDPKIINYSGFLSCLYILLDVTNTQKDLDEVLTFAKDLESFISVNYESTHFANARRNIRWLHKNKEKLTDYFNKQK